MIQWLQKMEISKAYKLSMVLIACLVSLSFFNIFFLIDKHKEYAQLINLSGKQRMLAEQAHSTLLQIFYNPSDENYHELESILKTMHKDYVSLKKSFINIAFDAPNIYTNGYKNSVLNDLYEPKALLLLPKNDQKIRDILDHREQIIGELNLVVEQLQQKSDSLNELMIKRGAILLLIILITLGIISILIFQPLLMRLNTHHQVITKLNSELELRVQERTKRLQKMLDIVNQYVYSSYTDTKGVITYVTDAFCELSGYSREELLGKTHSIIKHPDYKKNDFNSLWQTLLKGNVYKGIIKNRNKNGNDYWLESYIVPDENEDGTIIGFQAFRQNVTDKIRLEELNNELENRVAERTKEIERVAVTDSLTGLFNRHRFNQELDDALALYKRYQTPVTLAILDIDHFKTINDTYGHNIGDETLVILAELLQKQMRQTDKLARWGGEEFVILFINTELNGALIAAESLLKAIRNLTFREVGQVTCSIGLAALIPTDTSKSVLHRADTSLYRAKERGRNRVCYQYVG
ncbi:sensor domain-containing diguanylate cyclase [Sulfuricurvum sp.]|uniref:sensor domain-containing diguanylate cyclase n=1 Tax=Sulfuricurvum sp. TaxID=2025608 RepID=UPI002603863A|nr:sensor domain-containing diguanylate cyclase [Sulfuricurvum sp.]MDD2267142.1 sensor domain-containing diguanylate cyclase [Sulfuricurvum sp.]MDD2784662.1 sensor domain-containing diguanylate cyclase [Sulfuricurvum sp.]HZF69536.1 sensor domain-containing diguanylate cyclase [Sulfuricurvum sp.]